MFLEITNITLFEAWEQWSQHKPISEYYLWGIKVYWWGRIGNIALFAMGLPIIKSIGLSRIKKLGEKFKNVYSINNFIYIAKFCYQFALYFNNNSYLLTMHLDIQDKKKNPDKEFKITDSNEFKKRQEIINNFPKVGKIFLVTQLILAILIIGSTIYHFYGELVWYKLITAVFICAFMADKYLSYLMGIVLFLLSSTLLILYALILLPIATFLETRYLGKIITTIGIIISFIGLHFSLLGS